MSSHQPICLAVTGGIACGKSETGRLLAEEGFAVLDTDALAHEVMAAGSPIFQQLVGRFGEGVVGKNGELDRKALGTIVFNDPDALSDLNAMVHPAVIEAAEHWKARQSGDCAVLVPLLFETGWINGWSAVVCLSAEEETVFQRLEKRGLSPDEVRKRISAQMPLSEKKKKSDFVIENNDTLDALYERINAVVSAVRSGGK